MPATPAASPTPDPDAGLRAACADTLTELLAARKLIASQGRVIVNDAELQSIQDRLIQGKDDVHKLDEAEKAQLRRAIEDGSREAAALRGEIGVLKKQRATFWKKLKWIAIGVAAGAAAGAVFVRK